MKKNLLVAIFSVFVFSTPLFAQSLSEACNPAVGPFVVFSAKAIPITWLQAPVDVATNSPIPIDGFSYQIDAGAKVDVTPKPTPGPPCAAGASGAFATYIPYTLTIPSGVAKGAHTIRLFAWNFSRTVDASGNVVVGTSRQEVSTLIPFVVTDPVFTGPPTAPVNVKVWK